MDMNELNAKLNAWFSNLQREVVLVSQFVVSRLEQYPSTSILEKIAYPVIGVGLVLVLVGLVMFLF